MRKRGRPTAGLPGEPSTAVNVAIPISQYDQLYRLAQREQLSIPEVLRRGLALVLRDFSNKKSTTAIH